MTELSTTFGRVRSRRSTFAPRSTSASTGRWRKGAVGAGTGTVAFGWKGGIGTSSRVLPAALGGWTVGVLSQTNFGGIFQVLGAPVGKELGQYAFKREAESPGERGDGSCVMVIATDAPLSDRNLAATGGAGNHGSGANGLVGVERIGRLRAGILDEREGAPPVQRGAAQTEELANEPMSGLFEAAVEATEEAIYNSMFMATTTTGNGHTIEAIPLDKVKSILAKYGVR